MNRKSKVNRIIIFSIAGVFILMNVVAFFHAYKFTHFNDAALQKTKNPDKLSTLEKIKTLAFGIDNPKPKNISKPKQRFQTAFIKKNKVIECWYIPRYNSADNQQAKGTVIIFHGYSGHKSSMLDKSDEFFDLGYNTFLIDFMGSGGSEGTQCTLGFKEAEQVKQCFDVIAKSGEKNIYLFGTSMGAVAIMKAIQDYDLKPKGIILECPFGSMYKTTCARFRIMKAPVFPMASLLVFWGGLQNGFWAFSHNPTEYAKKINCPTLLLYGEKDMDVSREEIDEIYANLAGQKKLRTYKLAGHENYLKKYKAEWQKDIAEFLPSN
jgi:hypothetical protein